MDQRDGINAELLPRRHDIFALDTPDFRGRFDGPFHSIGDVDLLAAKRSDKSGPARPLEAAPKQIRRLRGDPAKVESRFQRNWMDLGFFIS